MRLKLMFRKAPGKIAAMTTTFKFPLLDLPNELIAEVIEHVDSRKTLRILSRTCKRIQQLTEPALYRYALVRNGARARHLLHSIEQKPARAKAIHELDIPCDCRSAPWFEGLARLLESAVNLNRLMLEMPQVNNGEFEDQELHEQMTTALLRPFQAAISDADSKPLQKLQYLVLHLNGPDSPYWTLDRKSLCIVQLPLLQSLTLSCVNIKDDLAENIRHASFTALKTLTLEEINITHQGLRALLSLPKALEVLHLGENCHNVRHFEDVVDPAASHLFENDPAATLEAIGQQRHSLKSLTYVTPEMRNGWRIKPPSHVDAGFAAFPLLEHVTLHGKCPNFERAVMSSRSPPNLKSLTYQIDQIFWPPYMDRSLDSPLNPIPFIRAPSSSVPKSLTSLRIIGQPQDFTTPMKHQVEAAARSMKEMGIHLEFLFENWSPYYPPYLYGEPVPTTFTIYDGGWKETSPDQDLGMWYTVED
ncbi:hypothetical protein CERZMDRAFT_98655 [Cercospora zeae-maydis SCOH1-5]|uniref:F-box domain-containing protein n=1 Tax=Cercospora zeae-maydis SCOH1-5 TaxID=717836 RepID=A0A6A6FD83_9PEZI|nr:hypothetical protein CERZMDRAFT_98655 [Cercospora zeae-maydis SCOH1-5]